MRIERYKTINYTPALLLATKGWLEQVEMGIGEVNASIHWEQQGIVAFKAGADVDVYDVPAGVITWTNQPSLGAIFAEQVYVKPLWRRQGIFKAMWADLMVQAGELGVKAVRLGTHPRNVGARAIYENTLKGRVFGVFYEFDVVAQVQQQPRRVFHEKLGWGTAQLDSANPECAQVEFDNDGKAHPPLDTPVSELWFDHGH